MTQKHDPIINGESSFRELVDMDRLQLMFDSVSRAVGYSSGLASYPDHKLLINAGWRRICSGFHDSLKTTRSDYWCGHTKLTEHLDEVDEFRVFRCIDGLADGAVPVVVDGRRVATLFTEQVLMEQPDFDHLRTRVEQEGTDVSAYLDALKTVPVVSESSLRASLNLLVEIVRTAVAQPADSSAAINESEAWELLNTAIAQSPSGILIADAPDVRIRMANPAALGIRGGDQELLTGIAVTEHTAKWQTFSPDGTPYPPEKLPLSRAVLTGETVRNEEVIIRDEAGDEHLVSANAAPIRNSSGEVVAGIVIFHDITEQKQALNRLKAEQTFSDNIIQTLPGLFYIFEENSARFVRRNALWTDVTGYTNKELDQLTALDLVVDRELCAARMQEVYDHGSSTMEGLLLTKSGEKIPYFFTGHRLVVEDRTYLVGLGLDISDRKEAEEALKRSEWKFRGLVESSSDWIWEVDAAGAYTYSSPQVERILGYKPEEVLGRTPFEFMPPDEAVRVEAIFAALARTRQPIEALENINLHKDGHRIVLETSGVPVLDNAGRLVGFRGVDRDISDRKRAEEEKLDLERQVLHAQKLESLGVLAGGIAHDFNNILMAILGNAELALDELPPHSTARRYLREIERASKRAAELATQMLAYSGKGRFVVERIDLNQFVREMTNLLEVSISKKAVLRFNLADDLPTIDGDSTQIRQVIMNLITNASEAIDNKDGVIALSTEEIECDRLYLDSADATFRTDPDNPLPEGRYVCLEVADTGCGMDRKTVARIFDPFFTTKFTGRGLGMSAVLGIVRGHRGSINIYTEVGRGTRFKILFPVSKFGAAKPESEEVSPKEDKEWRGEGTVLVVDDEEAVRKVAVQILEHLGFRVITAADGRQAAELFRDHADDIACVLLDLTMPHMDGEETYHEIRRIRPDTKVILCSGYSEQEATRRFAQKGLASFLQKPYSFASLRAILREMLK